MNTFSLLSYAIMCFHLTSYNPNGYMYVARMCHGCRQSTSTHLKGGLWLNTWLYMYPTSVISCWHQIHFGHRHGHEGLQSVSVQC